MRGEAVEPVTDARATDTDRSGRWRMWRILEGNLLRVLPGWPLLAAVDLGAASVAEQSWLRADHLSLLDRLSLFATEMAAAGTVLLLIALVAACLSAIRAGNDGATSRVPSAGRRVRLVGLTIAYFLYTGSWAAYRSTGRFLDEVSLGLWRTNPLQLVQHILAMEPWTLILVPATALAAAFLTETTLARPLLKLGPDRRRTTARRASLPFAATVLLAVQAQWSAARSSAPVVDPEVGSVYTRGMHYSRIRSEHTGPMAHLVGRLGRTFTDPFRGLVAREEVEPHFPQQISVAEYAGQVPRGRRPQSSIVVLLVESLRADQLTDYGSARILMPTVERLADRGHVWLDAYTQSSHSNYADLPPLSSHYPLRSTTTHVYPEDPPYPRVLLYDLLHELGYRTAIFSSQDENWGGMIHYLRTGGLDTVVHAANYDGPTYRPGGDWGFEAFVERSKNAGKIDDRLTVTEAIRWLQRSDRPFFIYMNLQNSHVPYTTPESFETRFGPERVDFPIRFGRIPEDKIGVAKDVYANSLAYVDSQIGRFVEALEDAGVAEETILVITGDTGQAFFEHGFGGHAGPLYEEVMRVPLIMAGGPVEAGVDSTPAEHVDIPPTLLHLLGLPPHPGFQGCDLLSSFRRSARDRYLVAQSPLAHQYAIVRGNWKLVYDAEFRETRLFDLRDDPGERRDLSLRRDSVTRTLSRKLGTWRQQQVRFYDSPSLLSRFYPPVVHDSCRQNGRSPTSSTHLPEGVSVTPADGG